jgi:hypothetical protein
MVRLYKELFGRGPTKARTDYAGPDTLVATIENSLTPAERNVIEMASTCVCGRYGCSSSTPATRSSRERWRR